MQEPVEPFSDQEKSGLGYRFMNYDVLETIGHTGENEGWSARVFMHLPTKSGYREKLSVHMMIKIDKINTSRGMQFTLCNDIHVQGGYISHVGNYGAGFTDCKDVLISGLKITNPGAI